MFDHFDAQMLDHLTILTRSQDDVLLGRVTYQEWSRHWPSSAYEPFAGFINGTRKHVVSSTPQRLEWANSRRLTGNLTEEIDKLREQSGKDIGVHGSVTLVRSLLREDLLDELRLAVVPVLAGGGRRLFAGSGEPRRLQLDDAHQTTSGVMLLVYRPRPASGLATRSPLA